MTQCEARAALLAQITTLLEQNDSAVNALFEESPAEIRAAFGDLAAKVAVLVENFDYPEALTLLCSIR